MDKTSKNLISAIEEIAKNTDGNIVVNLYHECNIVQGENNGLVGNKGSVENEFDYEWDDEFEDDDEEVEAVTAQSEEKSEPDKKLKNKKFKEEMVFND